MRRRIFVLAATLPAIAFSPAGHAHGPTRQKVSESVDIDAPPDAVWAIVGPFGGLAAWNPQVASSPADHGDEVGSKRIVTLTKPDAVPFEEALVKYSAADHGYMYRVETVDVKMLPVVNFTGWLDVAAKDGGGSTVTWRGAFYRGYPLNDPPPELNDDASRAAVTAYFRAGLDGLRAKAAAK